MRYYVASATAMKSRRRLPVNHIDWLRVIQVHWICRKKAITRLDTICEFVQLSPKVCFWEDKEVPLRNKTLSYRRAEWFGSGNTPGLEKCIRQALSQLKTVEDRTIHRDGRTAKVARASDSTTGGLLLHIATETPGESASVVPKAGPNADALDLRTEAPPDDGEWLDGDAFLYATADNICMCTTALHEAAVAAFIIRLFEKAKVPTHYRNFFLLKVADVGAVTLLQREGVKEIEMRATLYQASANYIRRRTQILGVLGTISREIKGFLKKPDDVTPDSLRVMLTIKADYRRPGREIALGEREMEEFAQDLIKNVEEGDEYVIITKTGKRITPNEIVVRETALIESSGKTVDRDKAWRELLSFHDRLAGTGVFEQ
jgi:hypothetical protein